MPKKLQAGGLHPADCKCGKVGCWSNTTWLKARLDKARKDGVPLPAKWPEKYRNMLILDGGGNPIIESKDGQVPSMSEQVGEILKRKPLPLPSEVRQQTIVTEQVPLQVDIPWGMIAATINGQLPPEAPPTAKIDASAEKSALLNESFHKAFPDVLVSPKLNFAISLIFWSLPAWMFWVPRWIKAKWKNMKLPKWLGGKGDEKKDGEPVAEKPEAKP